MQELVKAIKEFREILRKCEEEGDNFQETLGKLSVIKVNIPAVAVLKYENIYSS